MCLGTLTPLKREPRHLQPPSEPYCPLGTQAPRFRLGTLLFPGDPDIWVLCFGAMRWWWVPLMLVLAPWLPGNQGIQAGGPALWQWVALASWLSGVQSCLLCFGPPIQRARLCRDITGAPLNNPQHQHCLEALVQAAVPLTSVIVGA